YIATLILLPHALSSHSLSPSHKSTTTINSITAFHLFLPQLHNRQPSSSSNLHNPPFGNHHHRRICHRRPQLRAPPSHRRLLLPLTHHCSPSSSPSSTTTTVHHHHHLRQPRSGESTTQTSSLHRHRNPPTIATIEASSSSTTPPSFFLNRIYHCLSPFAAGTTFLIIAAITAEPPPSKTAEHHHQKPPWNLHHPSSTQPTHRPRLCDLLTTIATIATSLSVEHQFLVHHRTSGVLFLKFPNCSFFQHQRGSCAAIETSSAQNHFDSVSPGELSVSLSTLSSTPPPIPIITGGILLSSIASFFSFRFCSHLIILSLLNFNHMMI
ncbi:hypothetical protein PIB30_083655, partial [Stylosanthes scabra]|nr:hypothetical protein [Stylosanthes scabra]